jgi:hypothetical protein
LGHDNIFNPAFLQITSASFTKKLEEVIKVCSPIVTVLRLFDSRVPIMGKVYYAMFDLGEKLKALPLSTAKIKDVESLWRARWEMLHSDLHSAGFVMDPEFQSFDQNANEEVMEGFFNILEKLYPEKDVQAAVVKQLSKYKNGEGLFGRSVVREAAKTMAPQAWWAQFGSSTPELQRLAVKVLSQVSSASACERSWSTFEFIHNKRRNRLDPARANDLVYVFSNLRTTTRLQALDYTEQYLEWKYADDLTDSEEDV